MEKYNRSYNGSYTNGSYNNGSYSSGSGSFGRTSKQDQNGSWKKMAVCLFVALSLVTVLLIVMLFLEGLILSMLKQDRENATPNLQSQKWQSTAAPNPETTSRSTSIPRSQTTAQEATTHKPQPSTTEEYIAQPPTTECGDSEVCVDLDGGGGIHGTIPGVSIHAGLTSPMYASPCSRQVVLKVEFYKLGQYSGRCWTRTYGPQQMLKITMFFSTPGLDWKFDIGDSISNNGWAGDGGDSSFDAEVQGYAKSISAWSKDKGLTQFCDSKQLYNLPDALNASVRWVNVYAANNYVKVTNDIGLDNTTCSECLYGLNGQYDTDARGTADQFIYVAANRVINDSGRRGHGLCLLKLRWVTSPDE